jgi:ribonuclease P protein component
MPPEGRSKFPKQARLRKRPEFRNLARTGKKYHTANFVIITKNSDRCQTRLGVTVSSKVGNAVVRNRVKRVVREFFRRCRHEIRPHKDVLIIARKGAADLSLRETARELRGCFRSDRNGAS